MTPRVAFFTDSFHEVNGVALTSREFVGFAARRRFPFFSVHTGPVSAHWREGELETFEIAHSPLVVGLERDLAFDLAFLRHLAPVRRKLSEFRPDLIHVTGPSHAGLLGALLAGAMKVPLVASWHTNLHEFAARRLERKLSWLGERSRKRLVAAAEKHTLSLAVLFYRAAGFLFAPNPELVEMLESRTGKPTYLMQRGIDTRKFSPEHRTRRGGEFVIGFVGRLSPEKNVRMLADLERSLLAAGVRDCRFLIVGDGQERPWLAANLQRAEFTGVLSGDALAQAYADMDAFVFPSQTDTFGNVVLEAMASGVPAIVSREGGPKFLVESRCNGYVAGDSAAFLDAILELRAYPALREDMASTARATALTHSWDRVFEKVYARYQEAFAREDVEAGPRPMPLALAR